jgi:hypothetical protein
MVVWWACLAVLVGGGGEAKLALGRRYQSPFRQQQHLHYFAQIQFLEEMETIRISLYKNGSGCGSPPPELTNMYLLTLS